MFWLCWVELALHIAYFLWVLWPPLYGSPSVVSLHFHNLHARCQNTHQAGAHTQIQAFLTPDLLCSSVPPRSLPCLEKEGHKHLKWPQVPVPGKVLIWIRPSNMSGAWEINTSSVMWTLSCTADIWYPVWDTCVSFYNILWRVIVIFSCCSTCG